MKKLIIALLSLLSTSVFSGETINVPDDYATIQEALRRATSRDTVLVASGTYYENLWIGTGGTVLRSVDGPRATIIRPLYDDRPTLTCATSWTEISGFTFAGAASYKAVVLEGDYWIRFTNNILCDNKSVFALFCDAGPTTLKNNLVYNNSGTACMIYDGTAEIINNTFHNNGAGVSCIPSNLFLRNNIIANSTHYGLRVIYDANAHFNCVYGNSPDYSDGAEGSLYDISVDPMFAAAEAGRLDLMPNSPCIDAGHPDTAFIDPDGSLNDMGALPFDGSVPAVLGLHLVGQDPLLVSNHTPLICFRYHDTTESQVSYEIEAGTDRDWSTAEMWQSGTVNSADTQFVYSGDSLANGALYWIRVRVSNGDRWGLWSEFPFFMNTEPTAPTPVFPVENASYRPEVIELGIVNSVDEQLDSLTYDIELYADEGLSSLVFSAYNVAEGQDTTWSGPVVGLVENHTYYWRSRAFDTREYSEWSDVSSFSTRGPGVIQVPAHAGSIQFGVDLSRDGDTVLVSPGDYHESIDFHSKAIVVMSTSGPDSTVIRSVPNNKAVRIVGTETKPCSLEGFSIVTSEGACGVFVQRSCPTIQHCVFTSSSTYRSTGPFAYFSYAGGSFSNNLLGENQYTDNGSGVYIEGYWLEPLDVSENTFINNYTWGSGAIVGPASASNYSIHHNVMVKTGYGDAFAAIEMDGRNAVIYNNTISGYKNGIMLSSGDEGVIRGNIVVYNDGTGISAGAAASEYNCVFGTNSNNYPGTNGIIADPLFLAPDSGNYSLHPASPCINAGHPDPEWNDPDGTRNDIGALPFDRKFPLGMSISFDDQLYDKIIGDATPVLRWQYFDFAGLPQQAIEIEVGTDSDWSVAEVWSSGPISHTDTVFEYAGPALEKSREYVLRLRVSNGVNWGDWSEVPFMVHVPVVRFVPDQFESIQEALDESDDGDSVIVAPGIYFENVDLSGRNVRLVASGGPNLTVLQPSDSLLPVVRIYDAENEYTELTGFTILGTRDAHVVLIGNQAAPKIHGNVFPKSMPSGSHNAVIRAVTAFASIERNLFTGNTGYCVYSTASNVDVFNNTFDRNTYGMHLRDTARVYNNLISNTHYTAISAGYHYNEILVNYNNLWNNANNFGGSLDRGTSNAFDDPHYVDGAGGVLSLSATSPCIDSGDPDSDYNDPDGSRSDIGALPYRNTQLPLATRLHLTPEFASWVLSDLEPTLSWQSVISEQGPQVSYQIQITTDPSFDIIDCWDSGPVHSTDTNAVLEEPEFQNPCTYFLRIRLSDGSNWGEWAPRVFATRAPGAYFVPDDFASIKAAVEHAYHDDTILVRPGTYQEPTMTITRRIVVMSTDGPEVTFIRNDSICESLIVFDEEVDSLTVLSGFDISNNSGRGILCDEGTGPVISNCDIHDCTSIDYGGAIHAYKSWPRIVNNRIYHNSGDGAWGAAIAATGGGSDTIYVTGNEIYENSGGQSPAICLGTQAYSPYMNAVISRNVIWGNVGDDEYYASMVVGQVIGYITNNTIVGNTGGIQADYSRYAKIYSNIIVSNLQIGLEAYSVTHKYNNIWDNDPDGDVALNNGDKSVDPLFADASSHNYRLSRFSPCIDAGRPDCFDEDGTREDIGALPAQRVTPYASMFTPVSFEVSEKGIRALENPVTFQWQYFDTSHSSQTAYEIEVGTDNDWEAVEVWSSGAQTSSDTAVLYEGDYLEPGQSYYARARVRGSGDWGDWSVLGFRMNAAPPAPWPAYPANGDTVEVTSDMFVIGPSWDPDGDAQTFSVQVYADYGLTKLLGEKDDISDIRDFELSIELSPWNKYYWRVRSSDGYLYSAWSPATIFFTKKDRPETFSLAQNCPNPFNNSTLIQFAIPRDCRVNLEVYNTLGQKVRTLVKRDLPASFHSVYWWGRDDNGDPVASGVYLYRLKAMGFSETGKMILLK